MASNGLSSLAARLDHLADNLPPSLRQNPKAAAAAAVTALSVSIPMLSYAISSYRGFLALGPGGMPYNIFGWAIQALLQLLAKWETRDPSPFTKPQNRKSTEPHGSITYLPRPIPERAGDRPVVPGYVAPQRQTNQQPADVEVQRGRMTAYLETLITRNPGVLVLKPSKLEGVGTPAVWLDTSSSSSSSLSSSSSSSSLSGTRELPRFMRGLKGETTHVHPECSSHITLSMADAEEVVRKGWAERHRLSGVAYMPWSYVLIYAPRDEAEFEVWKEIMRAGVKFVCTAAEREVDVSGK